MAETRQSTDNMSSTVNDGSRHHQQRRHCRRFAPYSTSHEPWAACIAGAVHQALQRTAETHQPAVPIMRKQRSLASKMQLAAQSVVNMAAYLEYRERERVLTRASIVDAHALPSGHGNSVSEPEKVAEADSNEQDPECTMCCICLEQNRPNDARNPVQALLCGHVFHCGCINQWMSYRRCCPVDRVEVVENT